MIQEKKIKDFTDLLAWKKAHELVIEVYRVTKQFPAEEIYGLTSQMRRAAVSVTSNIAEGFGRRTYKDKLHFYYTSQGSLIELKNQLIVAQDVGYLTESDFTLLFEKANESHALLQGLITKTKTFLRLSPQPMTKDGNPKS